MRPLADRWVGFVLVVMVMGLYAELVFAQTSGAIGATKVNNAELQQAQVALAKHETMLMNLPSVVGVGVGMTEEGNQAAIHVYVNAGATGSTLPPDIPTRLDGIPVRVIKTDEIRAR
jgi:hypothetical protein